MLLTEGVLLAEEGKSSTRGVNTRETSSEGTGRNSSHRAQDKCLCSVEESMLQEGGKDEWRERKMT